MRAKPWIIFITLFSTILFCFIPPRSSRACGGGYDEEDEYTTFLNTNLLHPDTRYTGTYFWSNDWLYLDAQDELGKTQNLYEWGQYLKLNNAEKDIDALVYTSKAPMLDSLKVLISNRQALPERYRQNLAIKLLWDKKKTDVLDYIRALRIAEPITLQNNPWQENNPNLVQASVLCDQAKSGMKHAKNNFLRERYTYHAIRMAMLGGNAKEAVALYNKHVKKGKKIGQIAYWSMSYAAGAYLNLGDSARAAYMFSRLNELCPSRVQTARSSFKISTDENWEKCLKLCKNDHEKAWIWLLAGNTRLMPALECMNQAYKLKEDPKSLTPLLAQDMYYRDRISNRTNFTDANLYNDNPEPAIPETSISLTDSSRIALYNKIVNDKATTDKTPWMLAISYLHYENKEFNQAEEILNGIKADSPELIIQKDALYTVIMLDRDIEKSDEALEKELLPHLGWIKDENHEYPHDAKKYLSTSLWSRYNEHGQHTKAMAALMMVKSINNLQDNANMQDLDSLLAFQSKTNKIPFEKLLADKLPSRSSIMELKGTMYLADNDIYRALECFKQVTEPMDELLADPFIIHNHDCHDCDYNDKNKVTYTKLTLTEELLKLEAEKDKNPAKASELYFKLANAYYNITGYGNSWNATRYNYSNAGYLHEYGMSPFKNEGENTEKAIAPSATGMQKSLSYYMKAKELSNNREFQAKCIFMAAKCELNIAYEYSFSNVEPTASIQDLNEIRKNRMKVINADEEEDMPDIIRGGAEDENENNQQRQKNPFDLYLVEYFGKFNLLINQYSDTQYYEEVIGECSYLSGYEEGVVVNRNEGRYY